MSAVLAAVLAAYLVDLAVEKQKLWLFALLGAVVAFGAYGYFGGRTLVFVVIACYFIAAWLQPKGRLEPDEGLCARPASLPLSSSRRR